MKTLYSLTRKLASLYFTKLYDHKVFGLEHICKGRAIIASSHTSFLDPPLIAASWTQDISFLARKTLFSNFFFGSLIRRLNAYPVTGTAQDIGSIKMICQLLENNQQVVIFPAGLRSHDNTIGTIKSGVAMIALRCSAPIIPVYIDGCYHIWNKNRRYPKLKGQTACVIGSPIECAPYLAMGKKEGQLAMTEHVRRSIEGLKTWYELGAIGSPP